MELLHPLARHYLHNKFHVDRLITFGVISRRMQKSWKIHLKFDLFYPEYDPDLSHNLMSSSFG